MNWLRKVLGLCVHKWQVRESAALTQRKVRIGYMFILQCEHCGNLKKKEIVA